MITFKQLQTSYEKRYNKGFVEIKNRKMALNMIKSKTSCCWGAGHNIDDSGWICLASPSAVHAGDIPTLFVCKKTLLNLKRK